MSTFVGRVEIKKSVVERHATKEKQQTVAKAKGGRPNKAELIEEALALGIEIPEGATNPQIRKLIDEAAVI